MSTREMSPKQKKLLRTYIKAVKVQDIETASDCLIGLIGYLRAEDIQWWLGIQKTAR